MLQPIAGAVQPAVVTGVALANGTTTINLLRPGELYPNERVNQLDMRVAKILRFAGRRADIGIDIYNVLNSSDTTAFDHTFTYTVTAAALKKDSQPPNSFGSWELGVESWRLGLAGCQLLPGDLRRRCGLLCEFRLYKRGPARDVGDNARTAGHDLIEAGQPLGAFKFDGRADSRSNLTDLLCKSLRQEEPLRELGHAGKVFLTKRADVVQPRQKAIVA